MELKTWQCTGGDLRGRVDNGIHAYVHMWVLHFNQKRLDLHIGIRSLHALPFWRVIFKIAYLNPSSFPLLVLPIYDEETLDRVLISAAIETSSAYSSFPANIQESERNSNIQSWCRSRIGGVLSSKWALFLCVYMYTYIYIPTHKSIYFIYVTASSDTEV